MLVIFINVTDLGSDNHEILETKPQNMTDLLPTPSCVLSVGPRKGIAKRGRPKFCFL